MKQFYWQMGITGIRTEGLVEYFNKSFKTMFRKFVSHTGKDWNKWLPFLLFCLPGGAPGIHRLFTF